MDITQITIALQKSYKQKQFKITVKIVLCTMIYKAFQSNQTQNNSEDEAAV